MNYVNLDSINNTISKLNNLELINNELNKNVTSQPRSKSKFRSI